MDKQFAQVSISHSVALFANLQTRDARRSIEGCFGLAPFEIPRSRGETVLRAKWGGKTGCFKVKAKAELMKLGRASR